MSTVLRVKRRFDHEPLDALVIAGKRRKIESIDNDREVISTVPLTEVVKFAGTVKNQEDNVVEHLKKALSKDDLKLTFKQPSIDPTGKARIHAKEHSRENRYRVINYFRSANVSSANSLEDDGHNNIFTVIDVEHTKLSEAEATRMVCSDSDNAGYVYDLYYTQEPIDGMRFDDDLMIRPFEQELVFDNSNEDEYANELASDDSNSESNFRNDYPDSDNSANSIGDDDIRAAVSKIKLGDESSDLSSEDDFVYTVNEGDVECYGYKYAKYKARMKEDLGESNSDTEGYDSSFVRNDDDDDDNDDDDDCDDD